MTDQLSRDRDVRDDISKQHNSAIDDRAMESLSDRSSLDNVWNSKRPSPRKPNVETDSRDAGVYALEVSVVIG
jgi:hypothetical protein